MARRPGKASPPSSAAVQAVIDDVLRRRQAAEDPDLELLGDDPAGVVAHVLAHRQVPAQVIQADVDAALLIIRHLRAELDRQELALIRAGRAAGMEWAGLAGPLGVATKQAAEQRTLRLAAAHDQQTEQRQLRVEGSRPRGAVRSVTAVRGRRREESRVEDWLNRNELAVDVAVRELLRHRAGLATNEDLDDELDELEEAFATPRVTLRQRQGLVARLGLVLDALAEAGAAKVEGSDVGTDLVRALNRARALTAAYRKLRSG